MPDDRTDAPWSDEQVLGLLRYQAQGLFHPYTCPHQSSSDHQSRPWLGGDVGALLPTPDGWYCLDCQYKQTWAHEFSFLTPETLTLSSEDFDKLNEELGPLWEARDRKGNLLGKHEDIAVLVKLIPAQDLPGSVIKRSA